VKALVDSIPIQIKRILITMVKAIVVNVPQAILVYLRHQEVNLSSILIRME
jgi:hypothetical protein